MRKIRLIVSLVMIIALCAAGLPAQKVSAAKETAQASGSDKPGVPVITKLENKGSTSTSKVKITWTESEGADYYRIYRKLPPYYPDFTGDWEFVADTESTEYTDAKTPLSSLPKQTAYYKVRAVKKDADTGKVASYSTSEEKAIVLLWKPLKRYFNPKNSPSGIKIFSLNAYDTKGMIIYRKASDESSYTRIAKVYNCEYIDTDVEEGKTYSYRMKTFSKYGSKSPISCERTITRMGAPKLQLKKTDNGVKLTWTEVPGAAGYEVLTSRYNNSYSYRNPYADVTGTTYVDKDTEHLDEAERGYKVSAYYYDGTRKVHGAPSSAKVVG